MINNVRKALMRSLLRQILPWAIPFLLLLSAGQMFAAGGIGFAREWRTDEGLPDNDIAGLAQSSDGFLWVGTVGGLVRFDGNQFDEFSAMNIKEFKTVGRHVAG